MVQQLERALDALLAVQQKVRLALEPLPLLEQRAGNYCAFYLF